MGDSECALAHACVCVCYCGGRSAEEEEKGFDSGSTGGELDSSLHGGL